jgi:hypothetical protein
VVCSSSPWISWKLGLQVLGDVARHLVEPATEVLVAIYKSLSGNIGNTTGTVVLVEEG